MAAVLLAALADIIRVHKIDGWIETNKRNFGWDIFDFPFRSIVISGPPTERTMAHTISVLQIGKWNQPFHPTHYYQSYKSNLWRFFLLSFFPPLFISQSISFFVLLCAKNWNGRSEFERALAWYVRRRHSLLTTATPNSCGFFSVNSFVSNENHMWEKIFETHHTHKMNAQSTRSIAIAWKMCSPDNTSKFLAWLDWLALFFTNAAAADKTEKIKLKWKAFN